MMGRWWPAVLAPLLVVLGLSVLGNVWFVFLGYHVGLCLVVPPLVARREGETAREFLRRLGLGRERLGLGLSLGVALAAIPLLAHTVVPGAFPDADRVRAVLGAWGVGPAGAGPVLLFLALVNGPAEELFWRGWLQDRLLRGAGSAAALIVLFASYHTLTTGALAPGPGGTALMLAGVVAAAVFWTWSRHRWNSLWPALLSHAGATLGYVAVCWRILQA
jgi:hypothetical protein